MKNINDFILEERLPLTTLSWDNMILEDKKNSKKKIYDENIFKNSECFKIIKDNEEEEDIEEKENKKKEEDSKKGYEETMKRIEKLKSGIMSNTNMIKRDMEIDEKKREELDRQEKLRIEREKKEKEERERKKKEEEILRKKKEDELRKKRESEKRERELRMQNNDILGNGGTIRERLINAANNFEKIKNEIQKIKENRALKEKNDKILLSINKVITNISLVQEINENVEKLNSFLNEIKRGNQKELYLYTCYVILNTIVKRISSISDVSENYKNFYIFSRILILINSKTLTYMFFQIISNFCPYIIPATNIIKNNKNKNIKESVKENNMKNLNLEYFYFTFLILDINKNINIIEDYINNIERLKSNELDYLISNSFVSFINVFGNYITKNKSNWMPRIQKIKSEIRKGLENEKNKIRHPEIKSIINQILLFSLDHNFELINKNENTDYIKEMAKIK